MKKPMCTFTPAIQCARRFFFSFIPQGNEKNQQSIPNTKIPHEIYALVGDELGFFGQCGTVFYMVLYGAVRCIRVVTPVLSIDLRCQKAATL